MANPELTKLGESALQAWTTRDPMREQRLSFSAAILANVESAADASRQFPEMAAAVGEAVRQFEHGSIALLMNLTPLAADAGRRILEVVYYTAFLRMGPIKLFRRIITLPSWFSGDPLYSFIQPLEKWGKTRPAAATGPYGTQVVLNLYRNLSGYVHGSPVHWGKGRSGLSLAPLSSDIDRHEQWLTSAAKAAAYLALAELPDLSVDEIDKWFAGEWAAVRHALGLP